MAIKTPFTDAQNNHLVLTGVVMAVSFFFTLNVPISLLISLCVCIAWESFQRYLLPYFKKDYIGLFDWEDIVFGMSGAGTIGALLGIAELFRVL